MADEKNQNDQVQDLLARLRSQMSQLDEMFGIAPTAEEDAPPAVSAPSVEAQAESEEDLSVTGKT